MIEDWRRGNREGCPCFECGDRSVTCHGSCVRYRAWKDKRRRRHYAIAAENEVYDYETKNQFFRQDGPRGR